jgi:hypothetical protein
MKYIVQIGDLKGFTTLTDVELYISDSIKGVGKQLNNNVDLPR